MTSDPSRKRDVWTEMDTAWRIMMRDVFKARRRGSKVDLGRVLDVQCGRGDFWRIARRRFDGYVGVDSDPAEVEHASKRWPKAEFRVADPGKLDWPAGWFDVVFCWGWLSSLTEEGMRKPLSEMFRVANSYVFFDLPILAAPPGLVVSAREAGETFLSPFALREAVQAACLGSELRASWQYGLFGEAGGRAFARTLLCYRKGAPRIAP